MVSTSFAGTCTKDPLELVFIHAVANDAHVQEAGVNFWEAHSK